MESRPTTYAGRRRVGSASEIEVWAEAGADRLLPGRRSAHAGAGAIPSVPAVPFQKRRELGPRSTTALDSGGGGRDRDRVGLRGDHRAGDYLRLTPWYKTSKLPGCRSRYCVFCTAERGWTRGAGLESGSAGAGRFDCPASARVAQCRVRLLLQPAWLSGLVARFGRPDPPHPPAHRRDPVQLTNLGLIQLRVAPVTGVGTGLRGAADGSTQQTAGRA